MRSGLAARGPSSRITAGAGATAGGGGATIGPGKVGTLAAVCSILVGGGVMARPGGDGAVAWHTREAFAGRRAAAGVGFFSALSPMGCDAAGGGGAAGGEGAGCGAGAAKRGGSVASGMAGLDDCCAGEARATERCFRENIHSGTAA